MDVLNSEHTESWNLLTDLRWQNGGVPRFDVVDDPIEMLTPPPLGPRFTSFKELYGYALRWAYKHGYYLQKGFTYKTMRSNQCQIVSLHCDKAGRPYKSLAGTGSSVQPLRTIKCGCRFRLKAQLEYQGLWSITVDCGEHNHPPFSHPSEHQRRQMRYYLDGPVKVIEKPSMHTTKQELQVENKDVLADGQSWLAPSTQYPTQFAVPQIIFQLQTAQVGSGYTDYAG